MIEIVSSKVFLGKSPTLDRPHILMRVQTTAGMLFFPRVDRAAILARLLHPSLVQNLAKPDSPTALARIILALQERAGYAVEKFAVLPDQDPYTNMAVEFEWAPAAEGAAKLALMLVHYIYGISDYSFHDLLQKIVRYEVLCANGPSVDHRYLAGEARKRGIPASYSEHEMLIFGQGKYQRRMFRNITDKESHLAVNMSTDKTRTIKALHAAGLPVPEHIEVRTSREAVEAAQSIGFPVVVKPVRTDRGVGITVGISSIPGVQGAFERAREFGERIAVEEFIPGDTYRLLVVDGEFVAASRTEPTTIVGDGKQTVREIVDSINLNPKRGPGHLKSLTWLAIDDEAIAALKARNLTPESVLPPLHAVHLRSKSNVGLGGISVAVTEQVHEENRKLATLCAKIVGLDLAGIDFRIAAINQPWQSIGGAVLEVNTSPGLRLHTGPAVGEPADVAAAIFPYLYPTGVPSRIPVVAVTGTNGKTTTTRLITHIFEACGYLTGRATTGEIAVGNRIIEYGDSSGPRAARQILSQANVEAAVLETARGALIKYGLGFDSCDVAVILNVEADHLGEQGINTLDDLAAVKRVVADSASRAVVLNADDPRCRAMADGCKAQHVILFSMQDDNPAVEQHLVQGNVAYCLQTLDGQVMIVKRSSAACEPIVAVESLPMAYKGLARHNVQNALAAIATVEQFGFPRDRIVSAARGFSSDVHSNPGRLNFFPGLPFEVMVDFAHNKPGFGEIVHFINQFAPAKRKLCAFTMNGTRINDATACEAAATLAPHFELFVPFSRDLAKYRREGLSQVFHSGLARAGVPEDRIHPFESEAQAIDAALGLAQPGDFLALFGLIDPQATWERIISFKMQFENPPASRGPSKHDNS